MSLTKLDWVWLSHMVVLTIHTFHTVGQPKMPSILKLQQLIENAWKEGFDPHGSMQLEGRVVNTRKWIGATEIVAVLSSLHVKWVHIHAECYHFFVCLGEGKTRAHILHDLRERWNTPMYLHMQGLYLWTYALVKKNSLRKCTGYIYLRLVVSWHQWNAKEQVEGISAVQPVMSSCLAPNEGIDVCLSWIFRCWISSIPYWGLATWHKL